MSRAYSTALKCQRKSCGHIFLRSDADFTFVPEWSADMPQPLCPECQCDDLEETVVCLECGAAEATVDDLCSVCFAMYEEDIPEERVQL